MTTPRETLQAAINDLGITMESAFVPWSKSRNYKENAKVTDRSLNWKVTLKRNGRNILTTDYMAGIGHAPSYPKGRGFTLDVVNALELETEHGKAVRSLGSVVPITGKPVTPDLCDVVYSLCIDSDAIDHCDFEEWASSFGYDSDSRKAEQTYKACLNIALKLRSALGDDGLAKLRAACQDY